MTNVRRATAGDERPYAKFSDLAAWGERLSSDLMGLMNGSDRPMPQVETLLKRLIPILILAFLVVVAASRMLGIVAEYSRMEEAARHSTALTALTAKAALLNNDIVFTAQDRARAEANLVAALPSGSLADGTMVLLSGSNGRIFAGAGKEAMLYIGTSLPALLPEIAIVQRFPVRPAPSRPILTASSTMRR